MKSLVKLLLFLMLIVIPFSESKTSVYNSKMKIFNVAMIAFVRYGS